MSSDLPSKLRLGLEELAAVREQLSPLISLTSASAAVIETAAACAMLHSFYTEIEKLLKLIAREWDGQKPSSDAWAQGTAEPNVRGNRQVPSRTFGLAR